MDKKEPKISSNRQKKMDIVAELSEKFGKAKAIVFTNYQGLTHKQLENFKRAIKPLKAEYVVAKNSLLTLALAENKLKLAEDMILDGQTGTLFLYEDVITPLKELAKIIKELNLPSVKFGIMESAPITGEQVLKLSTLPSREVLLTQLAVTLKSPISGLHRALNWNIQRLIITLGAIVASKPATFQPKIEPTQTVPAANLEPSTAKSPVEGTTEPESVMAETKVEIAAEETPAVPNQPAAEPNLTEPETIMTETAAEVVAEQPEAENPTIEAQKQSAFPEGEIKEVASDATDKGGEN
jgi:large subunit ribosomal protein L10